jgi:hypothetical protein
MSSHGLTFPNSNGLPQRQMVETLLRSPTFHRGVQSVHKQIQKMRHGELPEEMGGTKLDNPQKDSFFKLFMEELKNGHKGDGRGKKNS